MRGYTSTSKTLAWEFQNNVKPNLFKPLFTTKSKGQGLGLAVVKRLVEGLGGTVSFVSEEGNGTKFTIRFTFGSKQRSITSNKHKAKSLRCRFLVFALVFFNHPFNLLFEPPLVNVLGYRRRKYHFIMQFGRRHYASFAHFNGDPFIINKIIKIL